MKLLEARIDGFGQLQGLHCPLDAPAVILYGLNEAGKSTLFGFIRTMLYGFSRRNQAAERMEPVNGGAHGGQLLFEDDAGVRYLAERYANKSGGKLMLRAIDVEGSEGEESWIAQDEWERRFLGGTNERLFRQLYAITLTELQEAGALSGDELGRYLYHAGWEGGNKIIAAEKRLQLEMESLFKPRGVNQTMNRQLKSLEQTESELRKQADAITTYNELKRQLERLELELEQLGEIVPKRLASAQLLAKACSVRPQWLQRLALQAEREGVAQAERISAEAEHGWRELSTERSARREELEQSQRKLQLYEQQREAIVLNESLLSHAEEVDSLLLGSERMELLRQERIELASELRSDDDVIGQLFSRIAPDWTEEQQAELSITVADREYVRGVRQLESEAAKAAERLNAELQAAIEQERDALQSLAEVDDELARLESKSADQSKRGSEFIPRTKEALRAAWNACDAALREWELERLRNGAANEAGRRGAGPWLWAGAATAGGAALALGVAAMSGAGGVASAAGAAALGGVALALAAQAWMRGRKPRQRKRGGAAMAQPREQRAVAAALAALVHEPAEAAAALLAEPRQAQANAPEHAQAAALAREQLRAAVDARLEELQSTERLQASRLELSRRLSRLQAQTQERRETAQAAAHQRAAAARQWRGWLEALALPQAMSPDATLEVFELAEQAMLRLQQRDRRAVKKAAAESQIAAFQKQAADLCAAFPEAAHKSSADPSLALLLLQTEMRRLAAAHAEAARLDERLQELHHSIAAAESRLIELNSEIVALLQAAAMPTEAAFVAALQDRGRLTAIDMEHNKLTIELSAGMTEKRMDELEQLLHSHDEAELTALRHEAASLASASEQERMDKLDTRGRLRQRLDHLLQEDEHRELLTAKEMTIAQLEQDAERYAILSVSAGLIRATKRIYEEERQPVVLRLASGFVNQLTEGRYIRVLTTPGDPSIRLESAEQRIVDSVMLSRGTAEQVYLAMRLALAVEAAQSANLPLLLDDLFVNFDRTRLRAAAELVAGIATKRQLILFTCHEHIRDALKEQLPQSLLYEMPSKRH